VNENTSKEMVKIIFNLEPDAWHGNVTESLWAERVGTGRYRLKNTPFYAHGVSFEDIIFAEERDGELVFSRISTSAGHSTYRIMPTSPDRKGFEQYWNKIEELGCTYEEGPVLAIDVPPETDIYKVYRLLEEGEKAGVWHFEEGHCGHPLRDRCAEK
jgi:hypothetical protein